MVNENPGYYGNKMVMNIFQNMTRILNPVHS